MMQRLKPFIDFAKKIYRAWMAFAHILGKINTAIFLTFFYFVIIGIGKAVVLLSGKDLLDTKWKDRPSYWKKRGDFVIKREAFLRPY